MRTVVLLLAFAGVISVSAASAKAPSRSPTSEQLTVSKMVGTWHTALRRDATANPQAQYPSPSRDALARLLEPILDGNGVLLEDIQIDRVSREEMPFIETEWERPSLRAKVLAAFRSVLVPEQGAPLYQGYFIEGLSEPKNLAPFYAEFVVGNSPAAKKLWPANAVDEPPCPPTMCIRIPQEPVGNVPKCAPGQKSYANNPCSMS